VADPLRPGEPLIAGLPLPGNHLHADLQVLIDFEHFQQIVKPVLDKNSQDLAIAVQVSVGAADYPYFAYIQHGDSGVRDESFIQIGGMMREKSPALIGHWRPAIL
jgi:hypothetical protein